MSVTSPDSVQTLKAMLRLEQDETGEDAYLATLLAVAEQHCTRLLDRTFLDGDLNAADQIVADHAARMLAASFYDAGGATDDVPPAVAQLLRPMRRVAPRFP